MKIFGWHISRVRSEPLYDDFLKLRDERDWWAEKANDLKGTDARRRTDVQPFRDSLALQQTEELLCEALAILMWYQEYDVYFRDAAR